jgi:chromosome segregation ATPase
VEGTLEVVRVEAAAAQDVAKSKQAAESMATERIHVLEAALHVAKVRGDELEGAVRAAEEEATSLRQQIHACEEDVETARAALATAETQAESLKAGAEVKYLISLYHSSIRAAVQWIMCSHAFSSPNV